MNYSTKGHPRSLTEAQIAEVVEWARTHRTARDMAKQLGVGVGLIHTIARTGGRHYKRAPPQ